MEKLKFKIIFCIIILVAVVFSFCSPKNDEDVSVKKVSEELIFDIPDTIKSDGQDVDENDLPAKFYSYARKEIQVARNNTQLVKSWMKKLEKVLEMSGKDIDEKLSLADFENNYIYWYPNPDPENNPSVLYRLKILTEQPSEEHGTVHKKAVVIDFTKYDTSPENFHIIGCAVVRAKYIKEGEREDLWRITFDTNKDDKKYMKVELKKYLGENLNPTLGYKQRTILKAWKDSEDMVELYGVTFVPGVEYLNYLGENENRYYLYEAKGNDEKATMNLAMPKDSYDPNSAFDSNTVGVLIKDYHACEMRSDAINDWSKSLIRTLSISNNPSTSSPYLSVTQSDISQDPANPTSDELFDALKRSRDDSSFDATTKSDIENSIYSMSVTNSAYFDDKSFTGFGTGEFAPSDADDYPKDLPEFNIIPSDLDGMSISFP